MVTRASHAHLGGIQIYQGTDPDLFDQFGADPASGSIIVSVKDHQVDSPSILHLSPDMSVRSIERWLNRHRFPSAFELTAGNFPDVMRSSAADLVVLTAVGRSDSASTETILGEASRVWNGRAHGPSVLFVWMDFEQWEAWLQTMYGVKSTPSVVLADHKVSQAMYASGFYLTHCHSICCITMSMKLRSLFRWTLGKLYLL
jgi:hypothetical protein